MDAAPGACESVLMSVLVTVVGDVSVICVDRRAAWSWCQLLASLMRNAGILLNVKWNDRAAGVYVGFPEVVSVDRASSI